MDKPEMTHMSDNRQTTLRSPFVFSDLPTRVNSAHCLLVVGWDRQGILTMRKLTAKLLFRFLHLGTCVFITLNDHDKPPGSGRDSLSRHCGSGSMIHAPQTTAPHSVWDDIPQTAAVGVGGRCSLLKPWRVPAWFRMICPELPPWEWEDNTPSSNHGGSLLGSG